MGSISIFKPEPQTAKNKFLFFNKKSVTLNLGNKITQQNTNITNKINFFLGIAMKKNSKKIPHLPSNDERHGYN
jgi:hypothetical protein